MVIYVLEPASPPDGKQPPPVTGAFEVNQDMDIEKVKSLVFKSLTTGEIYGTIRPFDTTSLIEGFPVEAWTPFAIDDCGNIFAVSRSGHIAFWDHETDIITKLADSFDEFAACCTKDEDVKIEEGKVISVLVNPDFKPEFD